MSELSDAMQGKEKGRIEVYVPNDFEKLAEVEEATANLMDEEGRLENIKQRYKSPNSELTKKDKDAQQKKVEECRSRLDDLKKELDSSALKFSFKPIASFSGKQVRALNKEKDVVHMADVLPFPPSQGQDFSAFQEWMRQKEKIVLGNMWELFEWRRAYMYLESVTDQETSDVKRFDKDEDKFHYIEELHDKQIITLFDALDRVFSKVTSYEATVRSVDF